MGIPLAAVEFLSGYDGSACAEAKADMVARGFARVSRDVFGADQVFADAFADLVAFSGTLPSDPYGQKTGRKRVFGKAVHHPDLPTPGNLVFQRERTYTFNGETGVAYGQPGERNPEHGGAYRVMKGLPESLFDNAALLRMIAFFFDAVPFDEDTKREAMQVGVHIVRMEPSAEMPSVASPDHIHCDGEPFTCAVLLDRANVIGGTNYITPTAYEGKKPEDVPQEDILAEFILEQPLDGYVVVDSRVAHYVSAVARAKPDVMGYRTILLIEFIPLQPSFVKPETSS